MSRLVVSDVCGLSRVTREDGARLRTAIVASWDDAEPVEIDFGGVAIASVSFFDEALALLALGHPIPEIARRIRLVGVTDPDRRLLNSLLQNRQQERLAREAAARPTHP